MNMEVFDQEKARQVWQRVQASPQPGRPSPGEALSLCGAQESLYRQLAQAMSGNFAPALREYAGQCRRAGRILLGLCRTEGRAPHPSPRPPLPPMPLRLLLERSLRQEGQLEGEYAALAGDEAWAQVCGMLSTQSAARRMGLLEMLGTL